VRIFKPGSKQPSETTRFMCASVFLGHDADIRKKLSVYVTDKHHAMADNYGLDARLLARVLDFHDQEKFHYRLWHGPVGLVCFLALVLIWMFVTPDTSAIVVFLAILAACALAVPSYQRYMRDHYEYALRYFGGDKFDAQKAMDAFKNSSHKLEDGVADREIGGNVTVFGGFEPFVGSGASIGEWSLLIDTRKGKEDETPLKFTEQDLEAAITSSFQHLPLPGLDISDRLCVHGLDVASVAGLLPDRFGRPRQTVDEETMARFRHTGSHLARMYKSVAVFGWGDQVRISFFYRLFFSGPMLYIETYSRVLQPVWTRYRDVDNLVAPKTGKKIALFIGLAVASPILCLKECYDLLKRLQAASEHRTLEKAEKKKIEEQARYNYGVLSSLRESFATAIYDHFFEKADRDLYVKTLQKQLLDAILDFLDSKKVDTSDLHEQRTYIINSGLIVHGGLQAGAVAVGQEAQATGGDVKEKPKKIKVGGQAA
jgi:hypothetical protein